MDCIFCKIISKNIPSKILYENDDTISFLDAFPVAKGHTLLIPKKHHANIKGYCRGYQRDLDSVYAQTKPHIPFSKLENKKGYEFLSKIGLSNN